MSSKKKKLFIIDGYAILYRAHYALIRNPLITSYGLNTSALFGFSNHLIKILKDEKPDFLVCAFDSKEKTFRHKLYSEYKANRPEMPIELQEQLPHLWELLESMNITVLRKPGFEADDIIGTITDIAQNQEIESYIVSGDKDFMQLINEKIFLYTPGKRNSLPDIYDINGVVQKWGLPPENIIDLLALMGDSSDNVPGVAGVGVKTAVKLLNEFKSLNAVLDNADKIRNKRVHDGLKNCKDMAILSKELVTIVKDVDIDILINDYKIKQFNHESLIKKYEELEFYTLIKELDKNSNLDKKDIINKNYNSITSKQGLNKLIKKIKNCDLLSIDLETTSINPMIAEIVGVSISIEPNVGYYVPFLLKDDKNIVLDSDYQKYTMSIIKEIFEDENIKKVGQNIKYDGLILSRFGIDLNGIYIDTMVAAHILNPSSRSYKLESLSIEYLNYNMVPIEDLIGSGKDQITMDEVPLEKITYYAAEDADVALQLAKLFIPRLEKNNQIEFFQKIEMPLISVLISMEKDGVFINQNILKKMSIDIGARIDNLVEKIHKISGEEFNINSTQQLATILFDKLKLRQIKKRSTAEIILIELSKEHELPSIVLEYRKLNKLKNTYIDALPALVNSNTDRVHSTYNQTIASTGRLSSTNPNFQNIPIRSERGRNIRKAFVPHQSNWKILSADYSQIELRVMAHLSGDVELCSAFNNNLDIHARTASLIFNVSKENINHEMRRTAKVINFGIMYGAGAFRISQELAIPRYEAQKIIDQYFKTYVGVKDYINDTINKARSDNFVETIFGRRRPIWDANSENSLKRKAAERVAINMPIQGSAAELIKIAMIDIHHKIISEGLKSKMIMQIHDELLFEFPDNEEQQIISLVVNSMENAMKLNIPIIVDYGIGQNWFEAH